MTTQSREYRRRHLRLFELIANGEKILGEHVLAEGVLFSNGSVVVSFLDKQHERRYRDWVDMYQQCVIGQPVQVRVLEEKEIIDTEG